MHPPSFRQIPLCGAGEPLRQGRRRLTVSILAVDPVDAAVGQDLDVETDAHVAVETPQAFDAQEVVAVAGGVAAFGREASDGAGEKSRVPAALAGPGGEATRGRPAAYRPWPQQPQEQRRQQRRGERHPGLRARSHGPAAGRSQNTLGPQLPLYAEVKEGGEKKKTNKNKTKQKGKKKANSKSETGEGR